MVLDFVHRVLIEPPMFLAVQVNRHLLQFLLGNFLWRVRMLSLGAVIVVVGAVQALSNEFRAWLRALRHVVWQDLSNVHVHVD